MIILSHRNSSRQTIKALPKLLILSILFSNYILFPIVLDASEKRTMRINLETATQIALTNYYMLLSIKNKNAAVKELIAERWRDLLPTLGLNVTRQKYIIQDSNDYIYNAILLNVDQIIYDGGKKKLDLDIAKLEETLTREDFKITSSKVKLEVQKNFINTLVALAKVALNKKSVERAKEQLRLAKLESKLGFTTQIQVLSVASRLQEIEFSLVKSINEYLKAKNDLKLAMSLDYISDIEVEGNLLTDFYIQNPNFKKDTLIQNAQNERSEILKIKINNKKLAKEKELAENAWIPQVSVGGSFGRTGVNYPLQNDTWNVNFKVTFPLGGSTNTTTENLGMRYNNQASTGFAGTVNPNFNAATSNNLQVLDSMSYSRKVMESKIRLGDSLAEKKRLEQSIAIEVEKAGDSVFESYDLIKIGSGMVYFRYESMRLMSTKLQVGDAKRADILFAETELVGAQEKLVDAIGKYCTSVYELEWVSGMRPDSLSLFQFKPSKGNTILPLILENRPIPKAKIDPNFKSKDLEEYFNQSDIESELDSNTLDEFDPARKK
ncbi:transporter [Leptospira stimsonii]|uniref:Transporter n=2 Tax=Leptospira stimsonii TaxID=2202203 RepID=A0A8B3CNR4_9LEPT|nr:TolC family protein [Leptospira stimsonii]RHX85414.1 transporter [Leptospira stimsonii]